MTVPLLKIGAVLSTMAMVTNWMSQTLPSLVGLNGTTISRAGTSEKIFVLERNPWEWSSRERARVPQMHRVCSPVPVPSAALGRRGCTTQESPCSHRSIWLFQVQNISQSMEVLDLRTYRDLQYVRNTESLMKGLDSRLKVATESQKSLNTKSFQVNPLQIPVCQWSSCLVLLPLGTISYVLHRHSARQSNGQGRLRPCLCCGKLTGVSNPITIRASGSRFGSWMTDTMAPSADSRVWYMDGYYKGRRVLEFRTLNDFITGQNFVQHLLPHPWAGTGHVVFNGSLYYNKYQSNIVVKYHFRSRSVLVQRSLNSAGYNNTFPYSWGGFSDIDFMVDENGLWAVYTTNQNAGNIVVSKVDPQTLEILRSWDTGYPKRSAGESFMICGTLYVTNSHLAGAKIYFAYYTNTSSYEYTDIPFHNQYSHISMLDYNPRERVLYTWNNGHQVVYNVTLFHVIKTSGEL
uniref:Olfactomedin 2 n=1 Tax=Terrapene triunguis TaxID=2587831 RepID=A0A674I8J5_9SAUR